MQLIKRMQEFGFTLRELGHFVRLLETQPHNPAERRACVEAKLAAVFLKHIPAEAATLYFKSGRGARPHLQCRVTRPGPAKRFCPNPPEVRQIVMPDGHEIKLGGETGEA